MWRRVWQQLCDLPGRLATRTGKGRRHRTGIRRQQMRWLGLAALVVGGSAVLFYFLPPFLGVPGLNANGIGLSRAALEGRRNGRLPLNGRLVSYLAKPTERVSRMTVT
jgi:hypothetical protein